MGRKIIRSVQWDKKAFEDFILILNFIGKDSPANAKLVKQRVMNIIKLLPGKPEMYKADELKTPNDGTFRVFVKNRIRVSYKIEGNTILIARVKHSSQEPIQY